MIRAPGIYPGLTMAEYLGTHAVSASLLLDVIGRCPAAARFNSWMGPPREPEEYNDKMIVGTVAHKLLLEGNANGIVVVDPEDHVGKRGGVPNGWTNDSIREARDGALAVGQIPILSSKMAIAQAMVEGARRYLATVKESEPAIYELFQPEGGDSEVTMVAELEGVSCRIRPDRISKDRRLVCDFKTGGTSAEPDAWGRSQLVRMGYYTAAALYRAVVASLCGAEPEYVYLVQEQEAPYLCSLVGLETTARLYGDKNINRALFTWKGCMRTGRWPAYPNRVVYPELPAWEISRCEQQAVGNAYDPAELFGDLDRRGKVEETAPAWQ